MFCWGQTPRSWVAQAPWMDRHRNCDARCSLYLFLYQAALLSRYCLAGALRRCQQCGSHNYRNCRVSIQSCRCVCTLGFGNDSGLIAKAYMVSDVVCPTGVVDEPICVPTSQNFCVAVYVLLLTSSTGFTQG